MTMREWNAEQKQAIYARGKSVVVSAAAGSGKTSVLTERVLKLVEEGEDIERMLIVTFTNLAASEMRERIYKRLEQTSAVSPRFAAQAEKCAFADISTLHAFCGKLIRENFIYAGTSPSFAIADESQSARLKQTAFEQSIDYAMQQESFYSVIKKYAARADTSKIQEIIYSVFSRAISLNDPIGWLDNASSNFNSDDFIFALYEQYCGMVREAAHYALPVLEERIAVWRESGFAEQADLCEQDTQLFFEQIKNLDINNVCLPRASNVNIKIKGAPNNLSARCTVRANGFFDNLRLYEGDFRDKIKNEILSTGQDGKFFIGLTQIFMERYASLKRSKNLLDHDDTMHLALRALSVNDVALKYRERYDHVFVDEYQDINGVQHAIISKLQREGNDFLVGDAKQCIYTFRESNPDLLLLRCKQLKSAGLIEMNTNYRSVPAVIEFVNGVMKNMISIGAGGIEYSGGQMLKAGLQSQGKVSIVLANDEQKDNLSAEIDEIIKQIDLLLTQGFAYNEIAVLRPELSSSGNRIFAALGAAGIPVAKGFAAGELSRPELWVFVSLLKIIDKIEDDIAILSVMRYPYFSFTEPELAAIRIANNPRETKSFFSAVNAFEQKTTLGKKVKNFLSKIEKYKSLSECMRLPDFLCWLREQIRLKDYALTSPEGAEGDAAVSAFIDSVASQKSVCIADAITVASRFSAAYDVQQSPKNADGVYLTTIHKSKGLEFRAVVLTGMHKVIDQRDTKGAVLVGRGLGLALDILDAKSNIRTPTFHRYAVARGIVQEKISETIRLLYVGMTRARQRLIVLGAGAQIKDAWREDKPIGWQHSAYTHFDLLMPAVQMMCKDVGTDLEEIVEISNGDTLKISQNNNNVEQQLDKAAQLESIFIRAGKVRAQDVYSGYPYENDIGVASKVSVSALKRLEEKDLIIRANINHESEGISAAQRGTLMHSVIEHIGLEPRTERQIEEKISELEKQKIIAADFRSYIDIESICGFLKSDLAQRARQSKHLFEQSFCCGISAAECGLKQDSQETVIVQGIIDLCFIENGCWVIVDYKTDRIDANNAPEAAKKYGLQLKLYAKALELITKMPVAQKYIYYLSAGIAVRLS